MLKKKKNFKDKKINHFKKYQNFLKNQLQMKIT